MNDFDEEMYCCIKCGEVFSKDYLDANSMCEYCAKGIKKHYIKGRLQKEYVVSKKNDTQTKHYIKGRFDKK